MAKPESVPGPGRTALGHGQTSPDPPRLRGPRRGSHALGAALMLPVSCGGNRPGPASYVCLSRSTLVLLVKARLPGAPSGRTALAYASDRALPNAAQAPAVPSRTLARMTPTVHSVALWSSSASESFAPVTVTSPHHSGAVVKAASCLCASPCAPCRS